MVLSLIFGGILAVLGALSLLYFYLINTYDYWPADRIKQVGRPIPGFGNVFSIFTLRESLSQLLHWMHVQALSSSNSSMLGFYFLRRPAVLLRQPRLIRRVLMTHKYYFGPFALPDQSMDPLLSQSSAFLGCDCPGRWRFNVRFTSDRLAGVFSGMKKQCASTRHSFQRHLDCSAGGSDSYHELEPHHWLTYHSTTVMLRFGLGEKNTKNPTAMQMTRVGYRLFKFLEDPRRISQHVYTRYEPIIAKVLGRIRSDLSSIVPKKTEKLFREAVLSYLNIYDDAPGYLRDNSLLNWLHLDAGENRPLLDDETIVRQLFAFHLEIYLVNAVIGSFALFHLAWNTNIQMRLRRLIYRTMTKPNGVKSLTYDDLSRMPYLDAVINETMRMHPVIGAVERVCRQRITLSGSDDQQVTLHPGDLAFVSTQGLHMDCYLWESPGQFDPDRFLTKNRQQLVGGLPLVPFVGLHTSRACDFHWTSLRLLLISMMMKFELTRSSITPRFPTLCAKSFATTAENGLWIKIKKLNRPGRPNGEEVPNVGFEDD